MSSPFQRAFSAKSPLTKHGEIKKLLRQAKRENPQDRSYEKIADLETEFANAKLAHKDNSSKEQTNLPSTADEYQSVVNMNYESDDSALKNKSKLNSKERKMVRQYKRGDDVKPRDPYTEVDTKKVLAEINKKKKTESVAQMRSPLNSYGDGGRGEVYLSEVDLIQNAANAVSSSGATIDAKDKKVKLDKEFADKTTGMDTDSAEYKKIYTNTYGAIVPTEKTE